MAKLALCIKRADAPQAVIDAFNGSAGMLIPIPASFWNTKVELVDRAICETDETWLQLLPYIALSTKHDKVFMYTRGGGGEEARLHGNYSLGVGGHVDIEPSADDTADDALLFVIRKEASREIWEEVKLTFLPSELNPAYFICDPTNPVGRVHLGLLINQEMDSTQAIDFVNGLEAGMIENARMTNGQELHTDAVYPRLENWSKLVADAFYPAIGGTVWTSVPDTASALIDIDSDWDSPDREVGGELINDAPGRSPDCDEDLEQEYDGTDECGECDQPMEDCTCDPDDCELCGNEPEDCACIENQDTESRPDEDVESNPFGER